MLNHDSAVDVAAMQRVRSSAGATLFGGGPARPRNRARGAAARFPHAVTASAVLGFEALPDSGSQFAQPRKQSTNKYADMTRIAPAAGGAWGPHLARKPV
ncbi:MAG: hypothetical protein ACYCO9_17335 [Streptosporangiaceae bacterium]